MGGGGGGVSRGRGGGGAAGGRAGALLHQEPRLVSSIGVYCLDFQSEWFFLGEFMPSSLVFCWNKRARGWSRLKNFATSRALVGLV